MKRWPPSAAQTERTVFRYAAFTKTQRRQDAREGIKALHPSCGPRHRFNHGSNYSNEILEGRCRVFHQRALNDAINRTHVALVQGDKGGACRGSTDKASCAVSEKSESFDNCQSATRGKKPFHILQTISRCLEPLEAFGGAPIQFQKLPASAGVQRFCTTRSPFPQSRYHSTTGVGSCEVQVRGHQHHLDRASY